MSVKRVSEPVLYTVVVAFEVNLERVDRVAIGVEFVNDSRVIVVVDTITDCVDVDGFPHDDFHFVVWFAGLDLVRVSDVVGDVGGNAAFEETAAVALADVKDFKGFDDAHIIVTVTRCTVYVERVDFFQLVFDGFELFVSFSVLVCFAEVVFGVVFFIHS